MRQLKALAWVVFISCLMTQLLYASPRSRSSFDESTLIISDSDASLNPLLNALSADSYRLSHREGAIDQITRRLESRAHVKALHLVAHGDQDGLSLAGELIDLEALERSAELLARWQVEEIMLWSCEVGQNQALITRLEELTGATIWSSATPLSERSGWALSSRVPASIDTPFNPLSRESFEGELARISFTELFKSADATYAEETSNLTTEAVNSLSAATRISFTSEDPTIPQFSGNNVSGVLRYSLDGGQTYVSHNGQVTRLFKQGSIVEGLYFIDTGADFAIDSGETNHAYILVVPTKEGTFVSGQSYGTSSDPVDDDLNDLLLLQPNAANPFISHDEEVDYRVTTNETVLYTFAFTTDIDEASFTAEDLGNEGTATVTIGTITETAIDSGIFTVEVTPTNEGTILMSVIAGADIVTPQGFGVDTSVALVDEANQAITCGPNLCGANQRVVSNACVACPPGTTNAAGDDASGTDTTCDTTFCGADQYVSNNVCTTCPPGTTNATGDDASGTDTTCDTTFCGADQYVSNNVCTTCPPGTTNAAGDDASGTDTTCDATTCGADERVFNNACVACPAGTTNAAGDDASGTDTACDATTCGADERVVNNACVACPAGSTNAAGDDASGTDTTCDATTCGADERVVNNACVACPAGTTNAAGDDASGTDSTCDATTCGADERVFNNACVACPPGTTNAAGDDASAGNTTCEPTICGENERVLNNTCVACPGATLNAAGDDASGADTTCVGCFADSDCGGDYCDLSSNTCVKCLNDGHCDDNNDCTTDSCGADKRCDYLNESIGSACGVDNACDGDGSCIECVNSVTGAQDAGCLAGLAVCDADASAGPTCVICEDNKLTGETDFGCDDTTPACKTGDGVASCVECLADGDCDSGYCDLNSNSCVECLNDGHCDDNNDCTTDSCESGSCGSVDRSVGAACGVDNACNGAGDCIECVDNAVSAADSGCLPGVEVCDADASAGPTCVICEDDQGVGAVDFGCSAETPACDAGDGVASCVECLADADCGSGYCELGSKTCVECLVAEHCDDLSECTADSCESNACVNAALDAGEACGEGDACDGAGSCIECVDSVESDLDAGCQEGLAVCDAEASEGPTCVVCEDDQEPGLTDFGCAEETPACDVGDGVASCVECLVDADCDGDGYCDTESNSCVECLVPAHCDDGNECTAESCESGVCGNPVLNAGEACGEGDVCDGAGDCIECVDSAQSADDAGCPEGTSVCDADATEGPSCVVCEDDQAPGAIDFGCAEGSPACLAGDGVAECVECLADADCGSGYCDPSSNRCVECLVAEHCDDSNECTGDSCEANACVNSALSAGSACGEGDACDGAGLCLECLDSAQSAADAGCQEGLTVCDADASAGPVCVVCEDDQAAGETDFGCAEGAPACLVGDGVAECVECLADADCDGGYCDLSANRCVECLNDGHCDDSNECTSELCESGACSNPSLAVGEACGEDDACDGAGACIECVDNATSELDSGCLEGVGVCDADATEGPTCVVCEDDQEPGVVDFGCAEGAPACLAGDGVAECVECLEDADCAEGTRCDLDNNSCVVCLDDAEAGSTDFGCAEESPACLIDEEGAAACVECIANEDCAEGSYCDAGSNSCVECLEDSHCDDGNACTTDVCVEFSCGAELDPAGQLCGEGDACDGAGLCVECVDSAEADLDAGCEEGLAVCDADASEGPVCVVCEDSAPAGMTDYGCSDETPACLAEDGAATCVQCLDGADCDSGLCDPVEHVCTSAPEITSGGGEELHSLTIVEGNTEVMTIEAEDADMDELSFSIDGGEDAALFEIDPSTGELSFITAPNVDEPADADEDNVYIVTVKVEDGTGGEDSQTIEITVIDDFFDRDGDGIEDSVEEMNGSNPDDIDSDDDGVIDSDEPDTYEDTDGDGIKNVNDPDSDNDGLLDGTELGVTSASDGTEVSAGNFIPDADPETTTDPLNPDTDAGGVSDGDEDTNLNGAVDEGERDPNKALDDIDADDDGFLDDTTLGGTGCDQSDREGAPWLLLSLLALLFASRRLVWRGALLLLAAASLLSVAQPLQAQTPTDAQDRVISEPSSFALNRYIPALTTQGVLNAQSARLPKGAWGANFNFGVSKNPLGVYDSDGERYLGPLVANRVDLNLQGWYRLGSLLIGLDLPVILSQMRDEENEGVVGRLAPLQSTGLGDAQLISRYQLLQQAKTWVDAALQLRVSLPSSIGSDYMGESSVTFWPELLLSHQYESVRWAFNLGYHTRPALELGGIQVEDELTSQLGVGWRPQLWKLKGRLDLGTSVALATTAGEPLAEINQNYLEAMLTAGWWLKESLRVSAFYGEGIIRGYGAPDWRFGINIAYEPVTPKDTDGDGLIDPKDKCPLEPEDKDKFEDEDGCPDPDNDQDKVLDVDDKCPLDPEDQDKFEDEDGCPDPDNDKDGILDAQDECPLDPEDKDEFEDENGCPDPDNDKDGILDVDDKCINEPGVPEEQGCPSKAKARVVGGQIVIIEKIFFKVNRADILKRSHEILSEVAEVLKAHPEIKIEIGGHTDSSGEARWNQRLSNARAKSVMNFLIKRRGISAKRLSAHGYGESKPKDTNCTIQGRGNNRRVEFVIQGGDGSVKVKESQAQRDTLEKKERVEQCTPAQQEALSKKPKRKRSRRVKRRKSKVKAAKKPAAKKAEPKKPAAKKPAAKKPAAKKPAAKKAEPKKPATKKAEPKKAKSKAKATKSKAKATKAKAKATKSKAKSKAKAKATKSKAKATKAKAKATKAKAKATKAKAKATK